MPELTCAALNAPLCDKIAKTCAEIAVKAGRLIMDVRRNGPKSRQKSDESPVCDADEGAESLISAGLHKHFPDVPIVGEEAYSAGSRIGSASLYFLVDALDGTAAYLANEDSFTVNIALIADGVPVVGVIYAPATRHIWLAGSEAHQFEISATGALPPRESWKLLHVRAHPNAGLEALVSLRYIESRSVDFLKALPISARLPCGSSLKFCMIASGDADIYPRFGPTMMWDAAAGHAILRAAGGFVLDERGVEMSYSLTRKDMYNPGFVAGGDANIKPLVIQALATLS